MKLILKHCDESCIDISFGSRFTPLVTACFVGHKPVVDLLIKCGADCNHRDKNSITPLYAASRSGHADIVDLLIKSCEDCAQSIYKHKAHYDPLSLSGRDNFLDHMVRIKRNYSPSDTKGETPLQTASYSGHAWDPFARFHGESLSSKIDAFFLTCSRRLMDYDRRLYEPYSIRFEVARDFENTDAHCETPLFAASYSGHADVVDLLIKGCAKCNQSDSNGITPLQIASYYWHAHIVDLLIKGGAKCNQSYRFGRSPLHVALYRRCADIIDLLIKGGADCNQIYCNSKTPLYTASFYGDALIVDLLIKGGAKCNQRNVSGRTLFALF